MFKRWIQAFIIWLLNFHSVRILVAKAMRTFVTDCPHCHQHFFGFNQHQKQVRIGNTHYRILCHRCVQKHLK